MVSGCFIKEGCSAGNGKKAGPLLPFYDSWIQGNVCYMLLWLYVSCTIWSDRNLLVVLVVSDADATSLHCCAVCGAADGEGGLQSLH